MNKFGGLWGIGIVPTGLVLGFVVIRTGESDPERESPIKDAKGCGCEKMFKIISHQGNSNQNHTEIPPYAS